MIGVAERARARWLIRKSLILVRTRLTEQIQNWPTEAQAALLAGAVRRAEYAIKVPFWRWLELTDKIADCRRWRRVDGAVSCFERTLRLRPWQRRQRVVIYRKRVHHQTRKNFQLDLFDPNDGYFEYSAIATNKHLSGRHLWLFMCGRGAHEKAYAELKSGFAFDTIPTQRYHGNCAWQIFSILAFNLVRGLQVTVGSRVRNLTPKRRALFKLKSIQTLRFEWLNRAGLMVRPNGRPTLDVGTTSMVRERFESISQALRLAA